MTARKCHAEKIWAIVIGVNYYPNRPGENLEGCVRDADHTRLYLEGAVDTRLHVILLTASIPPVSGAPPPEAPDLWPTYINVKSHLARVTEMASSGDRIYIHYSGHGTRASNDVALVLLHDDGLSSKCMRSRTLAESLKQMVEKGLIVTLVLDCCFSGGALRGHSMFGIGLRSIEYDTSLEPDVDEEADAMVPVTHSTLRDAHIEADWLINPQGYTILTACGPNEKAFEISANGRRHGALTYFLLRALHTLRLREVTLTHATLFDNISTNFHALWPRQTPMRYGNSNRTVFGELLHSLDGNHIPVYINQDGRLCLRAGHLHGVLKGDGYFACSFGTAARPRGQVLVNVRVESVGATESILVVMERESTQGITTGWEARQITSLSPPTITVRLASNDTRLVPPNEDLRYVEVVRGQRVEAQPSPTSCVYMIDLDNESNFQILDASLNTVLPFLTLPAGSETQQQTLWNVLQHMAKFKYFEAVENRTPCPQFEASFSIITEQNHDNSNRITIRDGEKWSIKIRNHSETTLYMGFFNFRPSWEVKCLTSAANGAEFLVIPAAKDGRAGERSLNIRMSIPPSPPTPVVKECEEVMKIFISPKQIRIRMALPDIVETANGHYNALRGRDDLSQFLSGLTSTFRGNQNEEWATRSFVIHTVA